MHPPSVDRLARSLADTGLPHPMLVDAARWAIAAGDPDSARAEVERMRRALLQPVVNATGVLLHTNLGRAPLAVSIDEHYRNLELDLASGSRGSRHAHAGSLLARACGADAALVVNNGAAAVLLVLSALARGRGVAVSRGELVEIGGGFRVPEVMTESGARLVEVGTTNRTRAADFARAIADPTADVAVLMKVHQSNYRITGFTEQVGVEELADLAHDPSPDPPPPGLPVVADIGSGLLDAACPWLTDGPPSWLAGEPAARQTLAGGADLVIFSGDKLLGGPQAGVIAGRSDLVAACTRHPLARALRPGGLVLGALQDLALLYLRRDGQRIAFWRMATIPASDLRARAEAVAREGGPHAVDVIEVVELASVPGGGTLPGVEIPSAGLALDGDRTAELRAATPPIVARVHDGRTLLDLRTVAPSDDAHVATTLARAPPAPVTVIATAGHVDHGKSTLVRALTGIDPDRFAEEQERGLTIDLGFAATVLPSGREISFVDVPGHVRFLKNMLAGVGAVSACLFVVAATEGWKPQSEEHLRILDVLGITHGVIALTKVSSIDREQAGLVALDVADRVAGTFLATAELVAVDGVDGTGLGELRRALDRLVEAMPAAADHGRPRLWVDRSFAARGAGTVVTGTLTGGALAVGDEVEVHPGPRGDGAVARVRSLQSHGRDRDRIEPGARVAVNLGGIGRDQVARGDALVRPGRWHLTRTVDASLEVLPSLDHPVSRRGAHLAYLGSGERPVRLRVLGSDALLPGGHGLVRLHLPVALPLLPGDRYVLRESGRQETIGGGEILDVDPVLPAARAAPDRSVDRVIVERGWVPVGDLERLTGSVRTPDAGAWVVDPAVLAHEIERVRALIDGAGPLGLDVATLDDHGRAVLELLSDVQVEHGRVSPAPSTDRHPLLVALEAEPFHPPSTEGHDRAEVRDLVRRGLIVEQGGIVFAASAVDQAAEAVASLLETHPEGVTVGQIREALATTRKYALPLLAVLDGTGRTRRRGDLRIAGPRL